MKQYRIKLSGPDREVIAMFTQDESGDCDLRCEFDGVILTASESDYFEALIQLRRQLETHGLRPHCNGASRNVYPSAMARQMSDGLLAYRLRLGRHSAQDDLVNIFETGPEVEPASVEEQLAYYEAWAASDRA